MDEKSYMKPERYAYWMRVIMTALKANGLSYEKDFWRMAKEKVYPSEWESFSNEARRRSAAVRKAKSEHKKQLKEAEKVRKEQEAKKLAAQRDDVQLKFKF